MPGLERRHAASRRVHRVNFVGQVQPTRMQETEVFREGEGLKTLRIQENMNHTLSYGSKSLLNSSNAKRSVMPAM